MTNKSALRPDRQWYILLVTLSVCLVNFSYAQRPLKANNLQAIVKKTVRRSFNSTVQIVLYDSVKKAPAQSMFSGVIVSAEGHIITVAHAMKPGLMYQVGFPDGSKYLARGLGRIAIKNDSVSFDLGMIKMLEPGQWEYAAMGSSASLQPNQLCAGISYPGSFFKNIPNVRAGKLLEITGRTGYFVSTCKMEPGDSGGPLFDSEGKVIGIHSWVEPDEDRNFEVPVDLYKKYWDALCLPEDYQVLPPACRVEAFPENPPILVTGDLLSEKKASRFPNAVKIYSSSGSGTEVRILGTLFTASRIHGQHTYIVSKSSMVFNRPVVEYKKVKYPLTILRRDRSNDLVLLQADLSIPGAIAIDNKQTLPGPGDDEPGTFLVSKLDNDQMKSSVLSSREISMPARFSIGFFGANATFINQKVVLTDIKEMSPASRVLRLKDQINDINGVKIIRPADYGRELMCYYAGDSITIGLTRDSILLQKTIYLPAFPRAHHVATRFAGGRSLRSDGFEKVYVHDASIHAEACGGPVFDLNGKLYGINIARHSRTSAIIMPADVIRIFIRDTIQAISRQAQTPPHLSRIPPAWF